jgi:hypothetical protein
MIVPVQAGHHPAQFAVELGQRAAEHVLEPRIRPGTQIPREREPPPRGQPREMVSG